MAKERFKYYCVLVGLAFLGLPLGALKRKNPAMIFPLFPMSIGFAYQYDMLYGNMLVRCQKEAARMLDEEPELFFLPVGNHIIVQSEYNVLVANKPADYQPKIKP